MNNIPYRHIVYNELEISSVIDDKIISICDFYNIDSNDKENLADHFDIIYTPEIDLYAGIYIFDNKPVFIVEIVPNTIPLKYKILAVN